jgi:hypothetical protein
MSTAMPCSCCLKIEPTKILQCHEGKISVLDGATAHVGLIGYGGGELFGFGAMQSVAATCEFAMHLLPDP